MGRSPAEEEKLEKERRKYTHTHTQINKQNSREPKTVASAWPSAHESHSCPSAVGRLQTEPGSESRSRTTPPSPIQLSLVWPLLYKFNDCTRLAQPPVPVPSQRTKPTAGVFSWLQSVLCESPGDIQFKAGKAFRGHAAVSSPSVP